MGKQKNIDYERIIVCKVRMIILLLSVVAVLVTVWYLLSRFEVTNCRVEGNTHYTQEQIKAMVMTGKYGNNSLFLSIKYKNKSITDVPFVERMDVSVIDKNTILITVYEKSLAGYVEYLGTYMYFDNKGKIVESSNIRTPGIPQVTGLSFDHVILHESLPVEDDEVFAKILSMTQLLNKYEVVADRIHFNENKEMVLYFGEVRVDLGDEMSLDEEIMQLPYILPKLVGQKGVLHLNEYRDDYKNITFEKSR